MANDVCLRFSDVTFDYGPFKRTLDEASFSLRTGAKVALMGQNGAGKSTLFKLITGELKPKEGEIFLTPKDMRVAVGRQVMPEDMKSLSVREYFATAFHDHKNNLDKLIASACETVNFTPPLDSKISSFSGGQQARLLLAHALIQEPDILLLDEPTNNLDHVGLEHLLGFLMMYEKTAIVISHDAEFLNAFTDGVLYLDVYSQKIEQYTGTYYDVTEEIKARIERENQQNARAETELKAKRAQAEVFAHKGGKLRAVAKRMREAAEEAEESVVDVRREDKTIRPFDIPAQEFDAFFNGQVLEITSVDVWEGGERVPREIPISVRRNQHVLISGPNGIGKSTFLDELATGKAKGAVIAKGVRVGYYKQDFSNLDYGAKAFDILRDSMDKFVEQDMRAAAAGFLLTGKELDLPVASLSEGQKALLQYCRIMLQKPGLLIMDEPTNHVNFRHLPVIAKALSEYKGSLIMVSHVPEFVAQVRVDHTVDLGATK